MISKSSKWLTFLLVLLSFVPAVDAQRRRSSSRTSRPAKVVLTPEQKTAALIPTVETKISNLNAEVDRVASRNQTGSTATDTMSEYVSILDESTSKLRDTLAYQGNIAQDLRDVLMAATRIDQFLARNRISPSTTTQWRSLKRDITTLATYNSMSWNWNQYLPPLPASTATGQVTPSPTPVATPIPTPIEIRPTPMPTPDRGLTYTVSDAQMSTLLSRIDLKTGLLRTQLQNALRSVNNDTDVSQDEVNTYISRLESAESRLRDNFGRRQNSILDVTDTLTAATYIDQFMRRNRLTPEAEAQWRDLRGDLTTLATYYQQSWNWNQTLPSTGNTGTINVRALERRITGTYRLNSQLSDDPNAVITSAVEPLSAREREDQRIMLQRRLQIPELLAIDVNNRVVDMASSLLPKLRFQADGRARSETNDRGRTMTTTATLDADGLTVNFQGQRATDFYLTIAPATEGRLRVTRRIFRDDNSDPIRITSIYDKIDNVARWDDLTPAVNTAGGGATGTVLPGDVPTPVGPVETTAIVPTGTRLEAELRTPISSTQPTPNFTMVVTTPGQFRGAALNGRVLVEDPTTRTAGTTRVMVAFDTITLPGGRTYRYSGAVDAAITTNGEALSVTVQNATSGTQPQRGAGAILGALIGAISGVPLNQGALPGGSIIAARGDSLYLGAGTRFTISTTTQP